MSMIFRKLIKPEDLNAANTLFGGTLMAWIDEAASIYAMCQMQTKSIVTVKVSEMKFKKPARQGDVLEFFCSAVKFGKTSFTLRCEVDTKTIGSESTKNRIAECEIVFVAVNENGRPIAYER